MVKDVNKIPTLINNLDKGEERILRKVGSFMEGKIKEKIHKKDHPEWEDITDETKKRKKSTKILFDTGKLVNSITHKLDAKISSVLIGVFQASIKVGDVVGEEAVNIAAVHEYGSPKRGIPCRSFIRSTFDEKKDEAEKLIISEENKILKKYS